MINILSARHSRAISNAVGLERLLFAVQIALSVTNSYLFVNCDVMKNRAGFILLGLRKAVSTPSPILTYAK